RLEESRNREPIKNQGSSGSCWTFRTELCRFSGQKIYPRRDLVFELEMQEVLSEQVKAIKAYMDCHDIAQEAVRKRRHVTKKPYSRAIVGALLWELCRRRELGNLHTSNTMGLEDELKHVVGVVLSLAFQVIANFRLYIGGLTMEFQKKTIEPAIPRKRSSDDANHRELNAFRK
ncbi:60S ribosomal protein L24-like protein, partial [Tanacetum coccineum]